MFLGYNTNGLAHHVLDAACELLAGLGYAGVAITLDHDLVRCLPNDQGFQLRQSAEEIQKCLTSSGLRSVIETGARFILDPKVKHSPNLMDADPERRAARQTYYQTAILLAKELNSDCVSIWSGVAPCENLPVLRKRLADELAKTLDFAAKQGVTLAFEPEPGMFIGDMTAFAQLVETLGTQNPTAADALALTLDVGHLWCMGEPIAENVVRYADRLRNVHLDDAVRGLHEHRMPGEGEIPFDELFDALRQVNYAGGVYVELSRHSAEGPQAARQAFEFFAKYF